MKILIACEFSGIVRDAFRRRGHEAFSCDLLPSESSQAWHIKGDVFNTTIGGIDVLDWGWDAMIHHAPCTYILNSGCKWLYKDGKRWRKDGTENPRDPKRWQAMLDGAHFFKRLQNANIKYIAGENPVMVGYAEEIIGKHSQVIHPWQFGHGETKTTWLWLKGLPPLRPTNIVSGREQRIHKMARSENRGHERSRTYPGIADAMAEQWGSYLEAPESDGMS